MSSGGPQLCLDADGGGDYPMTAPGSATGRSRSSSSSSSSGSSMNEYQDTSSNHFQLTASAGSTLPPSALSSLFTCEPPSLMAAKFGCPGFITPADGSNENRTSATTWVSSINNSYSNGISQQQSRAPPTAFGPLSYLMHAETPPIAADSILFSPAGLPPRHQPTLDSTLPISSTDYFTLISPSGTMQSLPQQPHTSNLYPRQQQHNQVNTLSHSYPTMIRPADTLLGPAPSASPNTQRPKLSHLAPLLRQGALQQQHHQLYSYQQPPEWTGPFSHLSSVQQPSNLSNSFTAYTNEGLHSHNRGISIASSSFTSSSSLSLDSLTWSPSASPTSSSYSQASSFQPQDSFIPQHMTERGVSPIPPYPVRVPNNQQQHGKTLPLYTYGHPLDRVNQHQEQFPSTIFNTRDQQAEQTQFYQSGQLYNQGQTQVQSLDQCHFLQQPDFSANLRDSISPVQMSLSPPDVSNDGRVSGLRPSSQQGGLGGITPTRSNFAMIAPTPQVPSLIARTVEALHAEVLSPESMSSASHSEDEEADSDRDQDIKVQEKPGSETRQLRRGRSGGNLSISSLSQQQQQSSNQLQQRQKGRGQSTQRTSLSTLPSSQQQQPAIVLPSKIKSLGTLPADEAFSASLEQLEDVPSGTKPPYLWWTLIRAAILGAPEQKLQMETLTQLIQQKYPYFGGAKEARNWKSSIRSVIHTKPCFYKSEDDNGNVWWHVDADVDPREQRRGMKKRSSVSSGSGSSGSGSLPPGDGGILVDAFVAVKNPRKLHTRDENADGDEEELDVEGEDDTLEGINTNKQTSSRKRRKSD